MSDQSVSARVADRFETADVDHPDPPEAPGEWQGGAAEDTDAGVVGRQWVEPERGLRVSYNLDDLKVTAERVEWDDARDLWRFTGIVAREHYTHCETDEAAMTAALEVIEKFENGEVAE
ncbi:hypothetical protein [Halospeciosus flavus]|uniref:Uncharacterized protein n=1 Tax=Halospeciosus flavus TaxID=3032283 RepID=A0ABD5Z5J6_9EURY|nr:hypothetical protein [Halospeciosus flavus]